VNTRLPRPTPRTLTTALLLSTAGLGAGLAGCDQGAAKHAARKDAPATTPSTAPTAAAAPDAAPTYTNTPGTPIATAPTTTTAVALPPSARTAQGYYPGKKLEPFWISMIAEADRAQWDDGFAAGPATSGAGTNDAAALQNALASGTKPARPTGDDGADGLTHVTFATEGADFDPCVSRDGKFMVFASTQHRPTSDIYLKSTTGRTVTQLTSDPANDVMPSISPDGKRVAFASSRSGNWDIYVMSAAGGQAMQITSDPAPELHPTWSPDGKRLAFCRLGETSGRWELWVTDVSGGGSAEFVGYGMFPQWCPVAGAGEGGRDRLLFQRSRERGDRAFSIWTLDYKPGDTSSPTEIVSAQGQAAINAAWSADGQRIVYATIPNPAELNSQTTAGKLPQSSLWMTSVDGTQRLMLTSGPFMNLMPCWAGDGRVYFVSDRTGVPNIWSIGTEKAVFAATGAAPAKTMDVTSVPTEGHAEHHDK
jgi:TolB protein